MVVTAIVGLYCLGFRPGRLEHARPRCSSSAPGRRCSACSGILAVQGVCSVAIIRYFLTEARDGFHWFKTLVAPVLGTLAMAGACYLLIANRAVALRAPATRRSSSTCPAS